LRKGGRKQPEKRVFLDNARNQEKTGKKGENHQKKGWPRKPGMATNVFCIGAQQVGIHAGKIAKAPRGTKLTKTSKSQDDSPNGAFAGKARGKEIAR